MRSVALSQHVLIFTSKCDSSYVQSDGSLQILIVISALRFFDSKIS